MGYYIQTDSNKGKAKFLIENHGAKQITEMVRYADIPEDKIMVVVVDNVAFEAAGVCVDEGEYKEFVYNVKRPKWFLLMDKKTAHDLSGFTADPTDIR